MTLKLHVCLILAGLTLCLAAQEPIVKAEYSYPFQGELTGDKVALHSRPTVYSETMDYLRKGQQLTVVGLRGDWFRVVLPRTINLWVEAARVSEDGLLNRDAAVYVGPSSIFSDLVMLKQGTRVERVLKLSADGKPLKGSDDKPVYRIQDHFIAILAPPNTHGWLYANYIKPVHPQAVTKATAPVAAAPEMPAKPLEQQLQQEAATLKADREKLQTLQNEATKLKDERAKQEATLAELRRDMQELEKQKEAATLRASQVRAEREEQERKAREELQRLQAESQEAKQRNSAIQGENTALITAAKEKELEIKAAQAELKRLEAQASAEKARIAAENAEQKAAFDAAKAKLEAAETERKQLLQRQEQLDKSVSQLQNAQKATETYIVALQKEQNRLEQTKKSEEANVAGLKDAIEKLSQEKNQFRQQAEAAQKELELLEETAKADKQKLDERRKQHEQQAKTAKEQAEAEAKAAQLALETARQEMKAAEAEQEKIKQQLEEAKAASLKAAQEAERLKQEREKIEAENKAEAEKLAEQQRQADERKAAQEAAVAAAPEPAIVVQQLMTGEVLPLQNGGNSLASHALCVKRNQAYTIVCYLQSPQLNLDAWTRPGLVVTVEGELLQPKGWKFPLLKVQSIMRKR